MAKEKYVSPEGYTVDVLEVFQYGVEGIACLVVQSNEDRSFHRSEIRLCHDFAVDDPETAFELPVWIYSIYAKTDVDFLAVHSGGTVLRGAPGQMPVVLETERNFTKICPSRRGAFIVGLDGYVGHFDGRDLVDMPVIGSEEIYMVSEAQDGTVMASGGSGGLFRLNGTVWTQIDLRLGAELYAVLSLDRRTTLFCGSEGVCGLLEGESLTLFDVPDNRDYYALAQFKGRTYFGAGFRGLDVLDGTEVVPIKDNVYCYELHASARHLFASGFNELVRFDGNEWLSTEFT